MKIEIDTVRDSHEDIQKAITLLQALLDKIPQAQPTSSRNIFENQPPASSPFGTLFDTPPKEPAQSPLTALFDTPSTHEKQEKQKVEYY